MADAKRIVRINYRAYMADIDRLYDTTEEAAAQDAGIYSDKVKYAPMAYVIGSKKLFPALEAALADAKVGEEFTVEVPCEEAAGPKNPKLIETHPIKEFYKQNINPFPGLTVSLGNKTGVVQTVGAGRVKVDFNNILAGHDLKYVMTIVEEIADNEAKANAIVEANFSAAEDFKFEFPGDKVVVILPEIAKFHQEWPIAKFSVVSALRDAFGVDTVEFVEVWSIAKKE
ncbi:MAG: FKBP-type peptidyl-prolyl cis-trans isomerase [archaeon]|nr:FKBP-type peptidyl-prolyl cis-trans isomerase [archaeon]